MSTDDSIVIIRPPAQAVSCCENNVLGDECSTTNEPVEPSISFSNESYGVGVLCVVCLREKERVDETSKA
jgi:hypothetical protein